MSASPEQKKYGLGFQQLTYQAKCGCGYQTVFLCGNLDKEVSLAPYYCDECGVVDVNFRESPLKCKWCKSTDIKPYGSPPVSLAPPAGKKIYPVIWKFAPAIWAGKYQFPKVYEDGNLCPQCKKMTLKISERHSDGVKVI